MKKPRFDIIRFQNFIAQKCKRESGVLTFKKVKYLPMGGSTITVGFYDGQWSALLWNKETPWGRNVGGKTLFSISCFIRDFCGSGYLAQQYSGAFL